MIKNEYSIFESELNVRPDDIDMFNHVHNSRYLDYVLAARYEQMEKFYGISWQEFEKLGYGWVVSKVAIHFKRALKMGDQMIVRTGILEMNEKGSSVQFEILNKKTKKIPLVKNPLRSAVLTDAEGYPSTRRIRDEKDCRAVNCPDFCFCSRTGDAHRHD